jgi:entericidin B
MSKLLKMLVLVSTLGMLVACNTIEGAGEDIESGGEAIQKGSENVQKKM